MSNLMRSLMDFLLPPLCLGCEDPVLDNQTLCAKCWHAVHFIDHPYCDCCGLPFDFMVEGEALCGSCHEEKPPFDRARSAFVYDEDSRDIILKFKHGDQLHSVPAMAKWMARAGEDFWESTDMIIPVPLHRWRLLKRRYNQAALLAQALSAELKVKAEVDGLIRKKATLSQGHMNKKQRKKNVAGAFALNPKLRVEGKVIVLVDDVMTSGATIKECARLLKKEGASMVNVVTLARAV